jgi:hypothetical protein
VLPGFKRHELSARYDVDTVNEDEWHAYTGERTKQIVVDQLSRRHLPSDWLLNAGAGVYRIAGRSWREIPVDLFASPIKGRPCSVCASVDHLPFRAKVFGAIICVGEVLAYCNPPDVISEFSRVAAPNALLVCDFASSRSARYWFRSGYGRAADLVTDHYNGAPEKTWVYAPSYIESLLVLSGFRITKTLGTHTLSAMARRLGARTSIALRLQQRGEWFRLPNRWGDVMTIVAERHASST